LYTYITTVTCDSSITAPMPQLLAAESVMLSKRWKSIQPTSVGNHSTSKNLTR